MKLVLGSTLLRRTVEFQAEAFVEPTVNSSMRPTSARVLQVELGGSMNRWMTPRAVAFACAVVLLGMHPIAASGADFSIYITGKMYMAMSDDQRGFYDLGAADMLRRMKDAVDSQTEINFIHRAERCISDMNGDQLRNFIDAYMRSKWANVDGVMNAPMVNNFRQALNRNCPN